MDVNNENKDTVAIMCSFDELPSVLHRLRKAEGITLADIYKSPFKWSPAYISKIENGKWDFKFKVVRELLEMYKKKAFLIIADDEAAITRYLKMKPNEG